MSTTSLVVRSAGGCLSGADDATVIVREGLERNSQMALERP